MGSEGASCFHHLSDQERDLSKTQWDRLRFGQVCTSSRTFAEWKAAIEKLCSQSGRCTYEVEREVENFYNKIMNISGKK
jgi:hypothetical protein